MGWKIRNNCPSDKYLEDYDKRVADREAELRRPGRSAEIEAHRQAQAAKAKAHQDFLKKWTEIHIKEVRRRNKFIRYELFLFFKNNYHLEDKSAKDLSLRALAAVCKSITKDVALYCQLLVVGEEMKKEKDRESDLWDQDEDHKERLRYEQCRYLQYFAEYEIGIPVDEDDALSLLDTYQQGTLLSKVISSHLKRDHEDVIAFLDLTKSTPTISGLSDPDIGRDLRHSISMRILIAKQDYSNSLDDVQKCLEKVPSRYDINNYYVLTPEQLVSARSALNTAAKIQAYNEWCDRSHKMYFSPEWSIDQEGLCREEEVLSSILSNDDVKGVLLEKVLDLQFNSNKLVSVTAGIRNQICEWQLSEDNGFDATYKKALEEHVGDFKEPQKQDPTIKELFGLDIDKEKRGAEFWTYFSKGFY